LIKLRAVAGDPALGRAVEELRDRFVYGPEPFDLGACRRLRRLQVEQLVRPGTVNAKYSPGALVDVDTTSRRCRSPAASATRRSDAQHRPGDRRARGGRPVDPERAERLRNGYRFFRELIDALRVVHGGAKDLTIPPPVGGVLAARPTPPPQGRRTPPCDLDRMLREVSALWDEASPSCRAPVDTPARPKLGHRRGGLS